MAGSRRAAAFFLRSSRDIERVKRRGRRVSTALFNLLVCPSERPDSRLAIIVGKRFGPAVRRNRAKRLFRELGRQVRPSLKPGVDCVVFPKREIMTLPFTALQDAWLLALRRQGLLNTEVN